MQFFLDFFWSIDIPPQICRKSPNSMKVEVVIYYLEVIVYCLM